MHKQSRKYIYTMSNLQHDKKRNLVKYIKTGSAVYSQWYLDKIQI